MASHRWSPRSSPRRDGLPTAGWRDDRMDPASAARRKKRATRNARHGSKRKLLRLVMATGTTLATGSVALSCSIGWPSCSWLPSGEMWWLWNWLEIRAGWPNRLERWGPAAPWSPHGRWSPDPWPALDWATHETWWRLSPSLVHHDGLHLHSSWLVKKVAQLNSTKGNDGELYHIDKLANIWISLGN